MGNKIRETDIKKGAKTNVTILELKNKLIIMMIETERLVLRKLEENRF